MKPLNLLPDGKGLFKNETFWSGAWARHIEEYLSAPPRCGYWLVSHFSKQLSFLEIAGGSCRDSHYLSLQGINAIGSDFDDKTLDYLKKRFPNSPHPIQKENAFQLSFANKSIDLSFSNGFWIYFNDDNITFLIREQERITKKFIVSLVHNMENVDLVSLFRKKATIDSLYKIRFFNREQLLKIISKSGIRYRSITMHKFGGPMDIFLSKTLKGISNPMNRTARRFVPRLYDYQPWSVTERIACVIDLG
jgi:hypothetical protein